jgi:hypothetical protein
MEKVYVCAVHLARMDRTGSDVGSIPRMDRADNDVGTIPWVYC